MSLGWVYTPVGCCSSILLPSLPPRGQPPPARIPGPASLASWNSTSDPTAQAPAALAPHEQAALDEIHRRVKEGAYVTIVVHPRNDPDAKSEVFMLDHASREFVSQLSVEARRRDEPFPTSLELPKPRKILLEWSADEDKAKDGTRKPEMMDASPRISPKNAILR